jgi:site-specific DNA-methyltransferase (adenine-specific)
VVYQGHALDILKDWPDDIINCVVTSPPYWVQRLYEGLEPQVWGGYENCEHVWEPFTRPKQRGSRGASSWEIPSRSPEVMSGDTPLTSMFCEECGAWLGNLGDEPFIQMYVEHVASVFDEVKRVLRDDGTCWIVLGDTYYGSGGGQKFTGKQSHMPREYSVFPSATKPNLNRELPRKCMADIPHRVVIEMVRRGWIHRSTVIWQKPNALPESAEDRPSVDYEFLFLITKKPTYYYEQQLEPCKPETMKRYGTSKFPRVGGDKYTSLPAPYSRKYSGKKFEARPFRNQRSVWSINVTKMPYRKETHYATFPSELIMSPIKAGCPKGGIVLDPFIGTGTTALVARALGRDWVGIELSDKYVQMTYRRLNIGG